MDTRLNILKTNLQSFGALRPEAWKAIVAAISICTLKPNEYFPHKNNCLGYVAEGILATYDMEGRSIPAIVNFTRHQQSFITRHTNNQGIYLKTCLPTLIFYWNDDELKKLHRQFNELKQIYDALTAEYEQRLFLRMRFLELSVIERISKFKEKFHSILPYLKKKDIANYLHLNYSHLVKIWNTLD